MKKKEFTQDELDFLYKNIKRGTIVTEKERIELNALVDCHHILTQSYPDRHMPYGGTNYLNYKQEKINGLDVEAEKKKLLEILLSGQDWHFQAYDEYLVIILYDSRPETDDEYMNRLYFDGRALITKERAKQKRHSSREARKVIIEKVKPKPKRGRPKAQHPIRNIHEYANAFVMRIPPPQEYPF